LTFGPSTNETASRPAGEPEADGCCSYPALRSINGFNPAYNAGLKAEQLCCGISEKPGIADLRWFAVYLSTKSVLKKAVTFSGKSTLN